MQVVGMLGFSSCNYRWMLIKICKTITCCDIMSYPPLPQLTKLAYYANDLTNLLSLKDSCHIKLHKKDIKHLIYLWDSTADERCQISKVLHVYNIPLKYFTDCSIRVV